MNQTIIFFAVFICGIFIGWALACLYYKWYDKEPMDSAHEHKIDGEENIKEKVEVENAITNLD